MAIKTVRIGSLKDIHRYDDGDYTGGLETDDDIYCEGVNCTDLESTGDVNIATGKSYKVNSIGVVTDQQAAEANAAAVSAVTITAGANTLNIAATDATLATLVTEINAIRTTLNSLLAKLRTHGLIDT